jgi:ATP phosphoribosyltransferase
MLIRAQEMARYVEDGILDAGLTGRDWVEGERRRRGGRCRPGLRQAELRQGALGAGRARGLSRCSVKDLEGKIIATELVGATKRYLERTASPRRWSSVLGRHRGEAAGAGRRHRRGHRNRLLAARQQAAHRRNVLESNTQLIANNDSWADVEARKLEDMRMLLDGAIARSAKVGLMLNVQRRPAAVLGVLPALKNPTISHLSDGEWLAVNTILDESTVRTIIPALKEGRRAGHRRVPAEQDRDVTMIRILEAKTLFGGMLARRAARSTEAERVVRPILEAVRKRGDRALIEYARKFDGSSASPCGAARGTGGRVPSVFAGVSQCRETAASQHPRLREAAIARAGKIQPAPGFALGRSCGRWRPWPPTSGGPLPPAFDADDDRDPGAGGRRPTSWSPRRSPSRDPRLGGAAGRRLTSSRWAARRRSPPSPTARRPCPRADRIVGPGNIYVAAAKKLLAGESASTSSPDPRRF